MSEVRIRTTALRAAIEGAQVSPSFMTAFTVGLTEARVFDTDTVDSIQLGILIGRLVVDRKIPDDDDFTNMVEAVSALAQG